MPKPALNVLHPNAVGTRGRKRKPVSYPSPLDSTPIRDNHGPSAITCSDHCSLRLLAASALRRGCSRTPPPCPPPAPYLHISSSSPEFSLKAHSVAVSKDATSAEQASPLEERPVAEWTVEEVERWCTGVETVADLGPRLAKAEVTGSMLLSVSSQTVKDITGLRGAKQCE